jgi:Ca2+-binding RTX toxin-like protein
VAANVSYMLAAGQSIEAVTTTYNAGTAAINLTGNELTQAIRGNAGANILNGKASPDSLTGLGGADTFVFDTGLGASNIDRITDYSAAADTIRLDKTLFTALSLGTLSASAYKDVGDPGAVIDASDRILYNDDSGNLFYDANGSAAGRRVQFATLDTKPATLTAADFFVVA